MHFALLAVLLGTLPVAHVGETLAVPTPGTLLEPGHFHAAVRIPHEPDRLFIIGKWTMQDLRVTIVRDGRRIELRGAQLPGARFGVELPPDAWQSRAVEIDGSSVNQSGAPKLVAGTALYARATISWPAIALFGIFAGFAIAATLLAFVTRSALTGWFAGTMTMDAAAALPVLGAIRPPALVNQSLHAIVVTLAIFASIGFARSYFGRVVMPKRTVLFAALIGLVQAIYIAGSDVWQDRWFSIPQPFDLLLFISLSIVFAGIGIGAIRGGRRDAAWFVVAALFEILGFFAQEARFPIPGDVLANGLSVVALSCGLAFALRRREGQLELEVRIDALTGLANRGCFDKTLVLEWSRVARRGGMLAVIMLDVDHFKRYNDVYGHLRGDETLRTIGTALGIIVQRREDCVARYGGEEFIAILPESDVQSALIVAEQIRTEIALLGIPDADGAGVVTVSVGVAALAPAMADGPNTLVALADEALYEAKRAGRNRVIAHPACVANADEVATLTS